MADDNGDGGGAWAQTPGQRKILHREEGDVQHGGHTRAAIIYNYNLRYVDEDRLEKKLKEVIAQVCVQSGLGAPAWAAPLKVVGGTTVDARDDKDISIATVSHDDVNVMHALDQFCSTTPVSVFGTDLTFTTLEQALATALTAEGRTPSAPREAHGPSVFVQLSGVPPQADADLDDVCDQLEAVYRAPVPTVQMCTKLDYSTGTRVKAQQNGRLRFHVACEEDNFKQVCRLRGEAARSTCVSAAHARERPRMRA